MHLRIDFLDVGHVFNMQQSAKQLVILLTKRVSGH